MKNKNIKIILIIIITIFLAFLTSIITNYQKINNNTAIETIKSSNENLFSEYINQNIEEVSPIELIGEKFIIKNIEFFAEDLVNVEYIDENNLYKARITFEEENEDIKITSFQIIETNYIKSYNFKKEGNIKEENGDYILIYDEEGAPATIRNLFFKEYTKCKDKNLQEFSCDELKLNLEIGERVEIIGYEDENNVDIYDGFEILYPDCIGCKPQCITNSGEIFNQE